MAMPLSLICGCKKQPGTGGLATISGRVYAYEYNNFGLLVDSGYVADERVYISYGGGNAADDNVRTGIGGEFRFEWLQKGDYAVWVISECDTCPLRQQIIKQHVTITGKKQNLTLPDFVIRI
ncbi:MAG: hypothetical protein NZM35_01430 [Chitinophagales bacterium]|nr:hypothetical protein [Chitinophagales bacterium]MDW8417961.1 hypothetical protein [Chitinophagales bacterium]